MVSMTNVVQIDFKLSTGGLLVLIAKSARRDRPVD